jgi:hypothetical protein
MNFLKQLLLPLDEIWRNAVYEHQCGKPVPGVEPSFVRQIDKNRDQMSRIRPAQ